jgi:hypothetical protein
MAVPWLQIVQLVPSLVEVSRDLLKRSRQTPPAIGDASDAGDLGARILALEENERRQAELVSQMAEEMAKLARAVVALHRRMMWITAGVTATLLLSLLAVVLALRS